MNPGPRFQCRLCKKYCKAADQVVECADCEKRFHASCANLGKEELQELELVVNLGIVQTARLSVAFAVV